MKSKKLFLLAANLVMLAVIVAIMWATLLPAIWGPNQDAVGEFGRREKTEKKP